MSRGNSPAFFAAGRCTFTGCLGLSFLFAAGIVCQVVTEPFRPGVWALQRNRELTEDDEMLRDGVVKLTPEGRNKLADELSHLRTEKRPALSLRIQEANVHGDISDNSEYEDLKEELVMTDARIHELDQTLERAEIVAPPSGGEIGLGSTVTILSADGEEETWRLVSPEEADTREGTISTDSPVGHALFGRRVGDSTTVATPAGEIAYTITGVR